MINTLLGIITVSQLRVSMATWRQVISLIFPAVWSIFTQSPTEKLSSIWRTNPPRILERLSCREKTITPLTTAEVATMPERVTPKRESSHNAAPPYPAATMTSRNTWGGARGVTHKMTSKRMMLASFTRAKPTSKSPAA